MELLILLILGGLIGYLFGISRKPGKTVTENGDDRSHNEPVQDSA